LLFLLWPVRFPGGGIPKGLKWNQMDFRAAQGMALAVHIFAI